LTATTELVATGLLTALTLSLALPLHLALTLLSALSLLTLSLLALTLLALPLLALTLLVAGLLTLTLLALLTLALLTLTLLPLTLLPLSLAALLIAATLALLALLIPITARRPLQLLTKLLDLVQRLLNARILALLAAFAHRFLGTMELIAEHLEPHGDRRLPRSYVSSQTATQPFRAKLHADLELVLLHLAEGFAKL